MLKAGSVTGEIAHRTMLKNVYSQEEIMAAVAGYFKQTKEIIPPKKLLTFYPNKSNII